MLPALMLPLAFVVSLWHATTGPERDGLERSVAVANAALAADGVDIQIEPLQVAFDAFHQKLDTTIPRGHGPDLFIAAHDRLGDWRRRALIAPAAAADLDAIAALQPSLPRGAYALAYDTGSLFFHAPFLLADGGAVFDDAGGFRIFDDRARASFARVVDLRERGVIPREGSSAVTQELFNRGRAAFVISGPWFAGGIELPAGAWAVDPLPAIGGRRAGSFVTVEGIFLSASASDPAAARRAAEALEQAWEPRTTVGLLPPVRAAAYAPGAPALPDLVRAQREALTHGIVTPADRAMAWVWEPVGGLLRDVIDRGEPLDAALARARQRLAVTARPPPEPADPLPFALVVGALGLAGALWLVGRALAPATRAAAWNARAAYFLSLPAWIAMALLVVAPFLAGAALSLFTHQDGRFTFTGLGNFRDILLARDFAPHDPLSFYFTLGVTVLWTVVNVALHTAIGLALALLLRKPWLAMRGAYRVVLILPWAVPSYITALCWRGMFDYQLGAINGILAAFGVEPVGWFQSFWTAFAANVATNTWLGFPFLMVVALGALQAIPAELEEVCALEGASRWQTFRACVWPTVRPALVPAVLLGSVWTFNMFNVIYLVSGGQPGGATEILISEAYKWAFQRNLRYGYAAAYAVIIFGILYLYGRVLVREAKPEAAS